MGCGCCKEIRVYEAHSKTESLILVAAISGEQDRERLCSLLGTEKLYHKADVVSGPQKIIVTDKKKSIKSVSSKSWKSRMTGREITDTVLVPPLHLIRQTPERGRFNCPSCRGMFRDHPTWIAHKDVCLAISNGILVDISI